MEVESLAELEEFFGWIERSAFDPDQPRDDKGRFSSLGATAAHAASRKAHRSKSGADHAAAAKEHDQAAANHSAEADRRRGLAKRAKTKADRDRHTKAADSHEKRAAEHEKLAAYHRGEAQAGRQAASAATKAKPTLKSLGIPHHLDKQTLATVEAGIRRGGFEKYLAVSPLSAIGTHERTYSDASGLYAHSTSGKTPSHLSVMTHETAKGRHAIMSEKTKRLGLELGHKDLWTVSSLAKTPEEMRERTVTHELGHHLHVDPTHRLSVENRSAINDAYDRRVTGGKGLKPGAWVVSAYARSSPEEWFAETHAAYVWHPRELEMHDPKAYALIQKVRTERGLSN